MVECWIFIKPKARPATGKPIAIHRIFTRIIPQFQKVITFHKSRKISLKYTQNIWLMPRVRASFFAATAIFARPHRRALR
jgi:hypothetical protein